MEAANKLLEDKLRVASLEYVTPANQPRGRPLKHVTRWELNSEDVAALKKAVNQKFLNAQNWKMGSKGEVVNSIWETVFEAGFINGIRKILANEESTKK